MGTLVVPDALRPWVAGIDVAAPSGEGLVDVDLPDPATTLVVRSRGGRPEMVVMGPRTRASYHLGDVGPSCVRVRLRPGRAGALLGRRVQDLADRVVPGAAFEGADVAAALQGVDVAGLAHDPVGVLSAAFAGRTAGDELVLEAAGLLAEQGVAATARRLHVSERQLRTLFLAGVGLSPKHFARIDRVRRVLANGQSPRWADVAASAGYYDQSHMTGEFRRLMGVPPAAFAAGRRPPAGRCG